MGRLVLLVVAVGIAVGLMMPRDLSFASSGPSAEPSRTIELDPSARSSTTASYVGSSTTPMTQLGATVLKRAADGHFYADASVNGVDIHFLVDTGASGVALSVADAQRVGLMFGPEEFDVIGSGASGAVRGKIVTLDRVSLDGRTADGVAGSILEGSNISLLGQSFLARMGQIEIANNEMIIR